jgi:hypothetical protein
LGNTIGRNLRLDSKNISCTNLEDNSIETSASQTLEDFEMVLNIAIHLLRGSAFLTSSEAKAKPRITLFVLIGYFLLEKSRQKNHWIIA